MSETQEDIEQLWVVSELEQRVATEPDAACLGELADRYDDLGWSEEAQQLRDRATELPPVEPEPAATVAGDSRPPQVAEAPILSGRFTPRSLVEVIRVLHLTEKSGHLVVEATGGLSATVIIANGRLMEAHATGGEAGEAALHLAVRIKGGCYHFTPGRTSSSKPNLPEDSSALVAAFAAEVAQD